MRKNGELLFLFAVALAMGLFALNRSHRHSQKPTFESSQISAIITTGSGDELVKVLFTDEFLNHWSTYQSVLFDRLNRPWPQGAPNETNSLLDNSELVDRMVILKALAMVKIDSTSAPALKKLLVEFSTGPTGNHWILQRETANSLLRPEISFSEIEYAKWINHLDTRTHAMAPMGNNSPETATSNPLLEDEN